MSSSLIDVLVRHCKDADLPRLPTAEHRLATLAQALSSVPDPRRVRGRRYRLGSLLAVCLVAVLGGARSLAQIARFAADCGPGLCQPLGLVKTTPNASTLGRLLAVPCRPAPGRDRRGRGRAWARPVDAQHTQARPRAVEAPLG